MNMKIKSFLARPFASYVYKAIQKGDDDGPGGSGGDFEASVAGGLQDGLWERA